MNRSWWDFWPGKCSGKDCRAWRQGLFLCQLRTALRGGHPRVRRREDSLMENTTVY